jgi:hypothetical protein
MESPEFIEGITGILIFIALIIVFLINIYGAAYDGLKKEIDKTYSENYSFSFTYYKPKIWFSFPLIIWEKTDNERLFKVIRSYNSLSLIFWLIVLLMLFLNLFLYK